MKFGPSAWRTQEMSQQREWLMTNGLGGYASTSITGSNNRRYHGLLIAAPRDGRDRHLVLSQISEAIVVGEEYRTLLSFHTREQYYRGEEYLREFGWNGMPVWRYRIGCVSMTKQVVLVHGKNLVIVRYQLRNDGEEAEFQLSPLMNFRNHHYLTYNQYAQYEVDFDGRLMTIRPFGCEDLLFISCDAGEVVRRERNWFYNMDYPLERQRGFPATEDHFMPGHYRVDLASGETRTLTLAVSLNEPLDHIDAERAFRDERARLDSLPLANAGQPRAIRMLARAADRFVICSPETGDVAIVAGYPWVGPWGRDSLISLPGLLLETGRFEEAASLLRAVADRISMGKLTNPLFPGRMDQRDSAVDGPLWLFEAVWQYFQATGDETLIREMLPILEQLFQQHAKGLVTGMALQPDGLLRITEAGMPLTWMNARVGSWIVTPRTGLVVEINALWYNSLRILINMRKHVGAVKQGTEEKNGDLPDPEALANLIQTHFASVFWHQENQCLRDVAGVTPEDSQIRPNQILAMSLSFPVLEGKHAEQTLKTVYSQLHTPVGFRSLNDMHPQYSGSCLGNQAAREASMHQGTVWPWFLGAFLTSWRRVFRDVPSTLDFIRELINPFEDHLLDGCLEGVTELADGRYPHEPRGCFSQAWSVAEWLRACREVQTCEQIIRSQTESSV